MIEEVAAPLGIHPTVVGGMAVYFWTEGDAFVTYDIDVVMAVPDQLADILAQLGFERSRDGRHWELPGTEVLLEAPSGTLDPDAHITEVRLRPGARHACCPASTFCSTVSTSFKRRAIS